MGDTEGQLRWALICGIDVVCTDMWHWALMGTGTWHCSAGTDGL
ncbi:unnamed protein product [Staurois parvus]|uniref:Uncharacterized protein n=1 Tax=Staurois parvus TaxID=386267 RepID=A0ABN9BB72_9NEOB|nr:unnamed protein product [Staurois parvus]